MVKMKLHKNSKFLVHQKPRVFAETKEKINEKMTLHEVLTKHPEKQKVFLKHGMSCFGCPFAMQETIEQGAMAHGINIKKLLEDLNK